VQTLTLVRPARARQRVLVPVGADHQSRSMTEVEMYTDGACRGNPGPGGWAALLIAGKERKEVSGAEAATTNNRMELMAAIGGLAALKRRCAVQLYTDSKYVLQASPNGCRSGRRAAGAPPRANLSRIRIYGRGSMRPRRRKISSGTGSKGIPATKAMSTWISSRTSPSIDAARAHEGGSVDCLPLMRQVVLDTETTGLEVEQDHRVIEIGCVELFNRRLTGRSFHRYLNPERDIDEGALEVHGLSREQLAKEPKFADIHAEFLDFVRDAELIIHNAAFDVAFLDAELARLADGARRSAPICRILDSLALARQMHPGQRNSLDALCRRYSVDNSHRDYHGALLDARCSPRCISP
jgi:DNA polymerase III epsilon subunit family exonuclease